MHFLSYTNCKEVWKFYWFMFGATVFSPPPYETRSLWTHSSTTKAVNVRSRTSLHGFVLYMQAAIKFRSHCKLAATYRRNYLEQYSAKGKNIRTTCVCTTFQDFEIPCILFNVFVRRKVREFQNPVKYVHNQLVPIFFPSRQQKLAR